MVSNETWGGAIAMQLRYTLICDPCGIVEDIDMEGMAQEDNPIGATFTCRHCGRRGIRPTVTHKSAARAVPKSRNPYPV